MSSLRNAVPLTWRPAGLSDAIDGTNAFPGAMAALANLVPAPHTRNMFVPRPAAIQLSNFAGFTAPAQGEALFEVGTRIYGMIASGRFAGKSEPFCFDTVAGVFVTISGVTVANTPTTASISGDWTPPTMTQVGSRVLVTHPGFSGGNFFGWLDMTGFVDNAKTGNTHSNTTIDTLSANVLLAGWRPGMTITDTAGDIPAGTRIVSIASNGLSCVISAAATASSTGTTFTVAGGTTAAPLWAAGNVNQNALVAKPTAVAQFSGRAYYAVNNAVAFSDSGDPLQATNATQVVTFQNGLNVTALAGQPLNNQLGGIIQSLMCFQGGGNIQQITGDLATTNLSANTLNEAVGTLAPNTVAPTPIGLLFIAPDGLRLIDDNSHVSEPIGANGEGVALPFIDVVNPSRMCAAYNEDVYRVSVTGNQSSGGVEGPTVISQEFWYHLKLKLWTGPHSFASSLIVASQNSLNFVSFSAVTGFAGLWNSQSLPTIASSYTENGKSLSFTYATVLLPDNEQMSENFIVETALAVGFNPATQLVVSFTNESGQMLDSQTITGLGTLPSLWGSMVWGRGLWGGGSALLQQRQISWALPLVFKQGQFKVTGQCNGTVAIGNVYLKYQRLGYLMQGLANAV